MKIGPLTFLGHPLMVELVDTPGLGPGAKRMSVRVRLRGPKHIDTHKRIEYTNNMKANYRDVVASIQNLDHVLDVLRPQLGLDSVAVVALLDARSKLQDLSKSL